MFWHTVPPVIHPWPIQFSQSMSLLDATPVSSNNPKQPATVSIIHAPHKASEKASGEPLTKEVFNEVHIIPTVPLYPPEGGLRAWLAIAGAYVYLVLLVMLTALSPSSSFVMFLTFGMIFSFGVFQDYCTVGATWWLVHLFQILSSAVACHFERLHSIRRELDRLRANILAIRYGPVYGEMVRQWPFPYFDYSRFHFICSIVSLVTSKLCVLVLWICKSFFMLSLCKPQQYYQFFLSQGIGMGLGMGLLTVPSLSIYSHYFQKKRGLANGILTAGPTIYPISLKLHLQLFSGSCLGGVLWPIMLNKLIESKVGFPWAIRYASLSISYINPALTVMVTRVGAFLSLGLLTAANFLMRKHPLAKPRPKMSMLGGIKIVFKDAAFIFSLIAYVPSCTTPILPGKRLTHNRVFISGLGLFFPCE